ncbi:hypothetical protein FACS1894199_18420 [Bacteroidia bacterium]|nr:hypothetical protein FACS1894199_18420 [Bacteroidia bacterium]
MTTLGICEQQLGCEPYICGNVDTGTVEEMSKQLPAKSVVMLELQ